MYQLIVWFALLSILALFLYASYVRNRTLLNSFDLSYGQVVDFTSGGTAGGIHFVFPEHISKIDVLMGVSNESCRDIIRKNLELISKYTFPVVYNKKNTSNAKILLFDSDFKKFDVPIPPELKGIVDELSSCFE